MSRLLTTTFTTADFVRSSLRLFEAFSYKMAPKGPPSSFIQHNAQRVFLTQPFPPPTLLGFLATTNLSATPPGPAGLSRVASGSLFMITAGASRVASGLLCLHAIAITPAGPMKLVRSSISIVCGLPVKKSGRLLRLFFRGLLSVHSSYGLHARGVAKRPFPSKATTTSLPPLPLRLLPGGANQFPGGRSHPLKSSAFSRRTLSPTILGASLSCQLLTVSTRLVIGIDMAPQRRLA